MLVGCGTATPATTTTEVDVRSIMGTGDGNDFLALSDLDRLRLCDVIEETIGQHEAHDYHTFIFGFYDNARRFDERLLSKAISEVAAVAAAMEFED
jgi:hypothetical protein